MAYGSSNNTSFEAQKWTNLRAFTISDATGNNTGISTDVDGTASVTLYLPSDIEANALTATTWETPRLLTIGATGKNVDGSADISWSMDEIMGQSDSTCFYRGDKTWSSTLTGTLYLTNTTDAAGNAANSPALIIGTATGQHLEFDPDEIMAKATGTTTGTLYINNNGGVTHFGGQLEIQAEATDSVGAIHVIDTRTDANWHYPFLGTCENLVSNGNMYLCVGKTVNSGDAGGLRYQWAATSSIDNLLGLHFSGVGTQLWCYADGSGGVVKEWTIGSRVTTTAPSALTSIDRIIITPYYRTDGPWFIKSEDDSTDAYLSLYYNSAKLIYTKHNGQTTINAPCSDTDYILQLNTTTTGTYRRGFGIFGTALTQGHSILFTIGKANSNKNLGYVGYYHDADAGTANRLIFGLHGVDNVINITGAGYVPIGDTIQFSNTTSWKKGTLIVGANSTDKVVIGYLNSSTNGATVGAHTSACTAWAPLYVAGTEIYIRGQEVTWAKWINGCLSLFPTTSSYREGIRIHSASSWSDITLCGNDNTGDSGTSANSWFIGNNDGNFYISRNGSSSGTSWLGCVSNVWKLYGNQTNSKSKQQSILHIYGPTYGNTAADMISGTAGLFSWGDGGPQITFDTNATPGGSQAGALIFTDHDTAATGASWHFVSNQSDWNVTSKRFHARTSISIGSDLPNTSYNFVLNGTANHTTGYWYINGGAGGIINGAATNGGLNSIRIGDDVWLGDCNAGGIMGMKSTGANTGFYFYNSSGTNTGQFYTDGTNFVCNKPISRAGVSRSWINGRDTAIIRTTSYSGYDAILSMKTTNGAWELGVYTNNILYFVYTPDTQYNAGTNSSYNNSVNIRPTGILYGACWNDYAEHRECDILPPGTCVQEQDNGHLIQADKRLISGASIISDTFGYAQGETEKARTPIAVSGRVLAYTYRNRYEYHAGMAVCSAPNGTIDIMTRDEIMMYPDAIIGIVSEIPEYEEWGTGNIKVNNRIWIKVR